MIACASVYNIGKSIERRLTTKRKDNQPTKDTHRASGNEIVLILFFAEFLRRRDWP
jgi:hypothetical protein